ncbi:MAG TPA: hypothetical protein VGG61_10190 [Gemmataceae bacterium]|jgi:hypothetical protein
MGRGFQAQLAALGKQVRAAAISGDWKHTSDSCFGRLPALYEKFCQTNESRYGEEISRRLQVMLNELASDERNCLEARKLSTRITVRLRLLHEQFGIPAFALKAPAPSRSDSPKAGRSVEEGQTIRGRLLHRFPRLLAQHGLRHG